VEEVPEIRALEEDDGSVVACEEHMCRIPSLRRQVEHPVVAEPVVCDREPHREDLLSLESEEAACEVNRLERPVDAGRVREQRAQFAGQRHADILP
jgi:hypothetical protein